MRWISMLACWLVTLGSVQPLAAQGPWMPEEAQVLNHSSTWLLFPTVDQAQGYEVTVRWAGLNREILRTEVERPAVWLSQLEWGRAYEWQVRGITASGKRLEPGPWWSFRVAHHEHIDHRYQRLRVTQHDTAACLPGAFFLDYARVAVDRSGNPLWFLPDSPGDWPEGRQIRDLKLTPFGTVTMLIDGRALEVNLDGTLVWEAPDEGEISKDSSEHYHHDFTRLENGHYLILGNCYRKRMAPDSTWHRVEFPTLLEYAPDGELVWSWTPERYFSDADLFAKHLPDGGWDVRTHANSVTPDSTGDYLWMGMRDLNRLIKIRKEDGRVVASYGERRGGGEALAGDDFFRRQHSSEPLPKGEVLVFNNNLPDSGSVSSVVIFSEADRRGRGARKVWEFPCNFDSLTNGKSLKMGNAFEMPNQNILVCMGALNRVFEVTREKEVVWSGFVEKYDWEAEEWLSFPNYRMNYAASLFPCLFTVSDPLPQGKYDAKKAAPLNLKVYNLGEANDSYQIRLFSPEVGISQSVEVASLMPGMEVMVSITPGFRFENAATMNLEIRSHSRPDMVRSFRYQVVP